MKLAGIILIVIGVLALVYQGFTYTQTKQDVNLGPIQVQHQERMMFPSRPSSVASASSPELWPSA